MDKLLDKRATMAARAESRHFPLSERPLFIDVVRELWLKAYNAGWTEHEQHQQNKQCKESNE